jgi:hypothetical protein
MNPLSKLAFKFNLRRYIEDPADKPAVSVRRIANLARFAAGLLVSGALVPAVGRCRLTPG